MSEKKIRFVPLSLNVRESRGGKGVESRVIEGRAIVFDRETVLVEKSKYRESEVIKPSCITEAFLKNQDIKLNLLHVRDSTVARNNKGVGSLKLYLRPDGLYFSAEMPKCDLGDQALELVRNKTYTGCSFEFYPKDYTITDRSNGRREDYLITHTAFERVTALTIAMDPAYEDTDVHARENREMLEQVRQSKEKQRQDERDRIIAIYSLNE